MSNLLVKCSTLVMPQLADDGSSWPDVSFNKSLLVQQLPHSPSLWLLGMAVCAWELSLMKISPVCSFPSGSDIGCVYAPSLQPVSKVDIFGLQETLNLPISSPQTPVLCLK